MIWRLKRSLAVAMVGLGLAVATLSVVLAPTHATAQETPLINYESWDRDATQAENALGNSRTSNAALDQLRATVVSWRDRFTLAQSANSARIDTLRGQIDALGPAPAEGEAESDQIATRRAELNRQLSELQAPGIAASEARGRAEGIVREIDRIVRERQADALLRLSPTPVNPVNWPAGAAVLSQGAKTLWVEVSDAWVNPDRRTELRNNLPVIVLFLAIAVLLLMRGPRFMERLTHRVQMVQEMRARYVAAAFVSLGQVVVPVVGTVLLVAAINASGMTGLRSGALIRALPIVAFAFFASQWLGSWLFSSTKSEEMRGVVANSLALTDRPLEGRVLVNSIGLVYALEVFRRAFTTEVRPPLSMAAQAVWLAPMVVLVSIFVFRLGMLLRKRELTLIEAGDAQVFRDRLISLIGTAAAGIAIVAPLLALVGYVAAANALIWPTVLSLGLIGLVILLQRFVTDIYLALTRAEEDGRDALIPVLAGFVLTVAALPVAALIWGARNADLYDLWMRFKEGVSIGQTRISPTAFISFVAIFALGYMATRLVQGALKTSVLPRTTLDRGAQNAIAVGIGYVGIVLAAFIAINATGLDLSSLAIVAGALSVGIGFGLQNIVSNFVSGIILLIERPISEGDTIEVGGKQGVVKNISVRSTRIETPDRTYVIVPNADLVSGVVTNLTRFSMTGRLVMPVSVALGTDTRKVQAILMKICEAQPSVLIDPAPSVGYLGFSNGALNFEIRVILSDTNLKGDVQTEMNHLIREKFTAEGIEFPQPQRDIFVRNADAFSVSAAPVERLTASRSLRPAQRGKVDPARVRNDPNEGEDPDRI